MVDQINAAGGVGELPVELIVTDIHDDPAAAQALLDGGVNALIGPRYASAGKPLLETVDGQVPIIFAASTDSALADVSRGSFLGGFTDAAQSSAMAEWTLSQGRVTAVTLSSTDDEYFFVNSTYFTTVFQEGGGTVLADYAFTLTDTDFSTQIEAISALSEPPDVLFTAMAMPQMELLLEQLDAAGLKEIKVLGLDGLDASVLWTAGDTANGVYFATHTFPLEANGSYFESEEFPFESNVVAQFRADLEASGQHFNTISFGALGADAVQILAAAATQACSVDAATLTASIAGLSNVPVTSGTVTYAGTDGAPDKEVVILTVTFGTPDFVIAFRPLTIPT